MANGIYEYNFNVNGATTKDNLLPEDSRIQVDPNTGQRLDTKKLSFAERTRLSQEFASQSKLQKQQGNIEQARLLMQQRQQLRIQNIKAGVTKTASIAGVVGALAFQHIQTSAEISGNVTQLNRLNDAKRNIKMGATVVGAFAVGGPIVGLAAVGYLAFNLAQENRKLIHEQNVDKYRSQYYQKRLINDISGRSRI